MSFFFSDNVTQPITTTTTTTTTTAMPTTKSTEIPKTTSVATETKIAREITENPLENLVLTTKADFTTPTSSMFKLFLMISQYICMAAFHKGIMQKY